MAGVRDGVPRRRAKPLRIQNVLVLFQPSGDTACAMQLALQLDGRQARFAEVDRRLRRHYSPSGPWLRLDPVSQLVLGMVGGRTYEADSRRAFLMLCDRYRGWERLRDAPSAEIREAIQAVTYAEVKARRLKAALSAVTRRRGSLSLDFLATWRVASALAWLESLPGVGRKTAAATLNFSTLKMPALVIDTHHLRVLRRLGFVGLRTTLPDAYDRVVPYLPMQWRPEDLDAHHQRMKTLGQDVCSHAEPTCGLCVLRDLCPSAALIGKTD